jgi:diguanylate cyclase (GGDEF)-like protein/putative nucleotidyltransferase with HDIG domain
VGRGLYRGPDHMLSSSPLSRRGRAYVTCVVVAGTLAIVESLYELNTSPVPNSWIVLALLTLFSGTFAIRVPSVPAIISVSETFVFTAVLLFGVAPATIIVALDGLIISLWRKRRHLHRVVFNGAEPAISIWIASRLFFQLAGIQPLALVPLQSRAVSHTTDVGPLVFPLVVLTVVYFLLNSWLTAIAVWLETGNPAGRVWRQHFLWLSLNYFGGASVALLIAGNTDQVNYFTLGLIVPLLIISYLTFKTALQRVEDARSHVSELNKLYLSTIETFAMWIDAKDQVTHGHIRRVQNQAVELARDLGVKDEKLLKAIEAAALLHDMGKLAVPEHILNKPGKLTSGEFEQMKLHAGVGAEILSSIDFPYPVVPIVRHHHENWDGTGYPDGLAGTDIPIGARILAVVDCFDALTSDRPYRPRLTDEAATEILLDRRSTMYDPLVVDAFMRVRSALADEEEPTSVVDSGRVKVSTGRDSLAVTPKDLADNGHEILSLYELARSLAGHAGLTDTADVIVKHLREVIPVPLCALFVYQPETDEIVAVHSSGTAGVHLKGLRLRLGSGVSGWVAANRCAVADADPRLELARTGFASVEGLSRAYSAPLLVSDTLVGVITLYSTNDPTHTGNHGRTLELLLPHISRAVHQAIEFDRQQAGRLRDALTGLPHFATVAQFITAPRTSAHQTYPMVVVFLDVRHLEAINQLYGTEIGDRVLMHVTHIIRTGLRSGDLLLRYAGDEFVALLTDSELATAECVALRLVESVATSSFMLQDGTALRVELASGYATAPPDGGSLEDLVKTARDRAICRTPTTESRAVH